MSKVVSVRTLASALPRELLERPQWVCHRAKVPYNPITGRKADSTDSETWGTFAQASQAYTRGGYDGIGFAFAEGAGIAGVDLDKCRDPHTGQLVGWAVRILEWFAPCYVEVSPSGTGLHLLMLGRLPANGRRRAGHIEMYDGGRYFTVTGDALEGSVSALENRQAALDVLYADLFPVKAAPGATPARDCAPLSMDDTELLIRARNNPDPMKRARFCALYDRGDTSGYTSASEADAALCNDLAYMCGQGGEVRAADLFRRSALYRAKADRDDYLTRTISLAYAGRTAFYQPRNKPEQSIDFSDFSESPSADEASEPPEESQLISDDLARLQVENARMRQQIAQIRAIVNADGAQVAPLEKVIQIDFIVNAFADEKRRNADGSSTIVIEARKDEVTGKPIVRPGLADKHGVSRGTISKALDNIKAFGTVRFGETPSDGNMYNLRTVAPPDRFAPKWERPGGPRKQMGGARPGAGRKPKQQGDPCDNPACEGILIERRGVETTEREFMVIVCPSCGERHGDREFTGKTATSVRYYLKPHEKQQSTGVDASPVIFENPSQSAPESRAQALGSSDADTPTGDPCAELLALAAAQGYPRIPLDPHGLAHVGPGEDIWRRFVAVARVDQLLAALDALPIVERTDVAAVGARTA